MFLQHIILHDRLYCMVYILFVIMVYILVGGSYSSVYVPPLVCIIHSPCSVYPCGIYLLSVLLYYVCLFLYPYIPLILLSSICVTFIHDWMKTFGGVCICVLSYAAKCVLWSMLIWYKLPYIILLARIVMVSSMLDVGNVCILACHSICIYFVCVIWTHSLPFFHFCHLSYVSVLIHSLPFSIFAFQLMPITLGWWNLWNEHACIMKDCPHLN